MPNCAIIGCKNRSNISNIQKDGITFHLFPKCAELKKEWAAACNRYKWTPTRTSTICSKHFEKCQFLNLSNGRRNLVDGAIPVLYLPDTDGKILVQTTLSSNKTFRKSKLIEQLQSESHQAISAQLERTSNDASIVTNDFELIDYNNPTPCTSTQQEKYTTMAPPFAACRICNKIEGKVKNYFDTEFYIKSYEDLTGCPFNVAPSINKFCPECACMLRKTFNFRNYCRRSHEQLLKYLNTGRKLTKAHLERENKDNVFRNAVGLSSWKIEPQRLFNFVHTPKKPTKREPKKTLQIPQTFYVEHMTVPKELIASQVPEKSEDDFSDNESGMHYEEPIDYEKLIPTPVQPLSAPTASHEPSEVVTLVVIEKVKYEDVENTPPSVTNEDETVEVKNEAETDVMTLQDIKDELTVVKEPVATGDVSKGQKRKRAPKKRVLEKDVQVSKKVQQVVSRAKRLKSNQDLEEHFIITFFYTEEERIQEFQKRRQGVGYLEGRFKCELCLKSFKEQKWMDNHAKKHDPSAGTYICDICKVRCRTLKLYRRHRDDNHTTRYACKRCHFITYTKEQARKHRGWHEGVEHTCQHCGASFRKHTTYMGHLRRVHPSTYICGVCALSFVSAHGLNLHMKVVHKDINNSDIDSTRCEECDVTFISHKIYIRHILTMDKHKDITKDILGCRKCGEAFDNKEQMEQHSHYKEKKYGRIIPKRNIKCDECSEVFTHPNGVYQHYLREHPDKRYTAAIRRRYLCEQCGKMFQSPGLLQQHALIHKGIRPPRANKQQGRNSCRECGKTYSKFSGLYRHKLTHLGVRRHKCHICDKAFTDASTLKEHVQGVHFNIRKIRKR